MKGIIILDGPDGCGKTTLAKQLQQELGWRNIPSQYIHAEYRFKNRMFTYHEALVRKAVSFSSVGVTIIDRLFWSEFVYGKVYRGGSSYPYQYRYFDRLLARFGALNVICTAGDPQQVFEAHKQLYREREEMYPSDSRIMELANEYADIYRTYSYRQDYARYDRWIIGENLLETTARHILNDLEEVRNELPNFSLDPNNNNLLGYLPSAKYLLIDADFHLYNGKRKRWPFWSYEGFNLKLTKGLHYGNFNERLFAYTNFDDDDGFMVDAIKANYPGIKLIATCRYVVEGLKRKGYTWEDFVFVDFPREDRTGEVDYGALIKHATTK